MGIRAADQAVVGGGVVPGADDDNDADSDAEDGDGDDDDDDEIFLLRV